MTYLLTPPAPTEPTPEDEAWVADVLAEAEATAPGDPAVVAVLRRMLALAEAGELLSVALVGETDDGGLGSLYELGRAGRWATLLGGVAMLQDRVARHGECEGEDDE